MAQILDRDVRDIANIAQLDRLPRLLEVLAEHAGQLVNHSSFGAALGLSSVTAQKYVAILERLFLVRTLAPWSSNRLSRLIKTPKLHFLDSGLLAALRQDEEEALRRDRSRFGRPLRAAGSLESIRDILLRPFIVILGSVCRDIGLRAFLEWRDRVGVSVDCESVNAFHLANHLNL